MQAGGGAWGAPMATSTQMGGGGGQSMYSGARQDSGLSPLQQHVLNVISSCHHQQGINIKDVVDSMLQHGHNDAKTRYATIITAH